MKTHNLTLNDWRQDGLLGTLSSIELKALGDSYSQNYTAFSETLTPSLVSHLHFPNLKEVYNDMMKSS